MPSCSPVAVLIWFSSSIPRGWEPTDRSASRGTAGRVGVSIALKPSPGRLVLPDHPRGQEQFADCRAPDRRESHG
jgi:hypothetical protein